MKFLQAISKSWMTTLCGVLTVIHALCHVLLALADMDPSTVPDWNLFVQEVVVGVALILARDANKTSKDSGLST